MTTLTWSRAHPSPTALTKSPSGMEGMEVVCSTALFSAVSTKRSCRSMLVEASDTVRFTCRLWARVAYSDRACSATQVSCNNPQQLNIY